MPPELTRLKMSTTTSTVLSAPVIASMWNDRSRMLRSRAIRSTYSANRSRDSSCALSRAYTAPGPSTKRAVTSTQRGSPFILTGAWNWNASDSTWNRSPANASGSPSKNDGGSAADDAVEGGDPLLTVEEELFGTGGRRATPHGLPAALGLPHEQCPTGKPWYIDFISPRTWSRFHT